MNQNWQLGPFTKYPGNPIIAPQGDAWEAKDVFNPSAWTDGDTIWMLYRAGLHNRRGVPKVR